MREQRIGAAITSTGCRQVKHLVVFTLGGILIQISILVPKEYLCRVSDVDIFKI
jgi:hypothetical protein